MTSAPGEGGGWLISAFFSRRSLDVCVEQVNKKGSKWSYGSTIAYWSNSKHTAASAAYSSAAVEEHY